MTASVLALLALFLLFLLISAFFAASETALVALSRIEMQKMKERGAPGAAIIEKLKSQPARLLSAALIGQNLANSAASAVATVVAENFLGERAGIAVAVVCSTLLLFSIGEMAPKSLAAAAPSRIALLIARPFQLFTRVVGPVAAVVIYVVNKTIGALGLPLGHVTMTEEEMKAVINMGHAEGLIRGEERERMVRVLEFGERRVSDVMVPRPQIVAIADNAPFSEVKALFSSNKFSRVPVFRDSLDDVIGVLRAKDLFDLTDEQEKSFTPGAFAAPPFLVPEFKRLEELFREMRRRKQHLAIAVDEYGGTAGLVTIEDIIESLLGSIQDEYDEESPGFVRIDDRTYILEGTYRLEELASRFAVRYPGTQAETVAGLLLQRFGRIPKRGERLRGRQAEYVVLDSTPMAIRRIKMVLPRKKTALPPNR
jgi:putative hemolysin